MADLQKRGSYTPRRSREQRAYRLVVGGAVAGTVSLVGIILALAGAISWGLPIVALIITALIVVTFRRTVGR